MDEKIKRTIEKLKQNNMVPYYAEKADDVRSIVERLISEGMTIGVGGSITLNECGIIDLIRDKKYKFFDRFDKSATPEAVTDCMKKSLTADTFISSANAITENGEIFNVDGRGNRVAAICFGPENVIIIAGENKIVADINEAVNRLKTTAAPLNAKRLNCKTPCQKNGVCISKNQENPGMCSGCSSDDRICSTYVISAFQRVKGRIKVILCGESLGY